MKKLLLVSLALGACYKTVPLSAFPTPTREAPAEVAAEMPAAQKAFADAYPKFEILRFTATGDDWGYVRNELSGTIMARVLEAHVAFRHAGNCYYTKPAFSEQHVDAAWGAPHVFELRFPENKVNETTFMAAEWVENARVTPMASCDLDAPATAAR